MSQKVEPDTSSPRSRTRGEADNFRRMVTLLAYFSVDLAAYVALRIWRMTRRYAVPQRELEWLSNANTEFLQLGKRRHPLRRLMCLRCWGDAENPTVLLVHGWGGRGAQLGAFAEPLVAAGYSVVAPDLPGHGDSTGKSTDFLECSLALREIQQTRGEFAAVIAHSFGAVVSCYALREGLTASACVLIGAPSSGEKIVLSYLNWLMPPQSVIERLQQNLRRQFGDKVIEMMSPKIQARSLTQPCLVLHDEGDRDVAVQAGKQLADSWPNAQFVETSGLGHRRILRDSASVQRAVEFIAQS